MGDLSDGNESQHVGLLRLLYVGISDWDSIPQRSHHIVRHLSDYTHALYINPCYYSFAGYLRDVACQKKTPRRLYAIEYKEPCFQVVTLPPLLPKGLEFPFIARLNYLALTPLIRRVALKLHLDDPVLWLSLPPDRALIGKFCERLVVYDCMDRHAAFRSGRAASRLSREEERLLQEVDVVFASSQDLFGHCARYNDNVYLVRNGVDAEWFRSRAGSFPSAHLAREPSKPMIGYVGTIGPWVDVCLLREIASSFPGARLELVGPVEVDLSPLENLPNVRLVGQVPYESVPALIQGMDVCLLPFKINDLTRAVNPIKLYEYFALGKPVVSTPLPELALYDDLAYLAEPGRDFIEAVRQAIDEGGDSHLAESRRKVADENSWARRAQQIMHILEKHL